MKTFSEMKCGPLEVLKYLATYWKSFVVVLVPVLFLPLALVEGKEAKCGFVICVMASYWITEALPLPVTSLIPIVLFPIFGILSTDEVCLVYFKETNVMFLGGVIIAIAIEHSNLHKRMALKIILMMGTSPQRLLLGFMSTTMFLSMWISNAAATALMMPIVTAVLDEIKAHKNNFNEKSSTLSEIPESITSKHNSASFDREPQSESKTEFEPSKADEISKEEICYYLAIAYAANIGGTGTITGSATNLTFKGIFESIFPNGEGINFASWMAFNVPLMLFTTFIAWMWLQILYMDLFRKRNKLKDTKTEQIHIHNLLLQTYNNMGPMTYHEFNVLVLFLLDVLLWFTRKPEFIPGWGTLFPEKVIKDATPAIAVAILLFILPANLDFLKFGTKSRKANQALLNWKVLREKIPFGIILLLGGGFAIAKATEVSGLSAYLGYQLEVVNQLSPEVILAIMIVGTTFATEVSCNTAIANIFLPVLAQMSQNNRLHPLYLMLPTTICCSYAFMLPVATPPNAIVMATSKMKTSSMMKAGIGMNLLCITSLIVSFIFIGAPLYGFTTFPEWAESRNSTFVK